MTHARAFATLTASAAALWLAAHCIAKARAEFLSAQREINSRKMRRDTAHRRRMNIIIAVTAIAAITLLAHLRGWI